LDSLCQKYDFIVLPFKGFDIKKCAKKVKKRIKKISVWIVFLPPQNFLKNPQKMDI